MIADPIWECLECHIKMSADQDTCGYCEGNREEVGIAYLACPDCWNTGFVAVAPHDELGHHDIEPCPRGCSPH